MQKRTIQIFDRETLDVKNISKVKTIIIGLLLVIILSSFSFSIGNFVATNETEIQKIHIEREIILNEKYNQLFSEEDLVIFMQRLKMKHIDIVLKQAKIESGNFKSKVFIENNNLFGMRLPGSRVTMAIGENLKHAVYNNWKESVIDYAIYQSTYLRNFNRKEYLQFLEKNYAENSGYIDLINKMK